MIRRASVLRSRVAQRASQAGKQFFFLQQTSEMSVEQAVREGKQNSTNYFLS